MVINLVQLHCLIKHQQSNFPCHGLFKFSSLVGQKTKTKDTQLDSLWFQTLLGFTCPLASYICWYCIRPPQNDHFWKVICIYIRRYSVTQTKTIKRRQIDCQGVYEDGIHRQPWSTNTGLSCIYTSNQGYLFVLPTSSNLWKRKLCVCLEKIRCCVCFIVLEPFTQLKLACLLISMLASVCKASKVALLGFWSVHGGINGHFMHITINNIRNILVHGNSHLFITNSKTVTVALSLFC